jgi:hypothetical protein
MNRESLVKFGELTLVLVGLNGCNGVPVEAPAVESSRSNIPPAIEVKPSETATTVPLDSALGQECQKIANLDEITTYVQKYFVDNYSLVHAAGSIEEKIAKFQQNPPPLASFIDQFTFGNTTNRPNDTFIFITDKYKNIITVNLSAGEWYIVLYGSSEPCVQNKLTLPQKGVATKPDNPDVSYLLTLLRPKTQLTTTQSPA